MLRNKFFIGLIVVGVLVGAFGLVSQLRDDDPASEEPTSVASLDAASGTRPLSEIAELWRARAEQSPQDYISRAQLGATLVSKARATGDLALYDEAERVLTEALQLNPSYETTLVTLAQVATAQHEFTEALELAERVNDARPESLSALALIGDAKLELGDYPGAADAYESLADAERSAPAVSRLARLAGLRGEPEAAIALAEEAVALSADLPLRADDQAFFPFQLGFHQFQAGEVDSAATSLNAALDLAPDHPGANELLGRVLASQGRVDAAIEQYRSLLATGPAADLHGDLAELLRLRGDGAAADEQVELGLELAAETIGAVPAERRHLAGFLTDHDPQTALRLAEADIETRQDVYAYDTLAWALFANGRTDDAVSAIDQALDVGTRDAELLYHGGVIHAAAGNDDLAAELLGDALAINPTFDVVGAPLARATLEGLLQP